MARQRVEADSGDRIARVENDDVVGALRRDRRQHLLRQVTVRVNQPRAMSGGNVGRHHVQQQR